MLAFEETAGNVTKKKLRAGIITKEIFNLRNVTQIFIIVNQK